MNSKHLGVAAASVLLALMTAAPARAAQNGHLPDSELAEIYLPGGSARLQKDAAAAWNAMRQFCISKGVDIYPNGPNSAYRTVAQQVEMKKLYGSNAATPGTSNHGLGLAVDVATHEMRSIIDKYGAQFGWSKKWSDAPWEWWHIKYKPGVWDGRDRVNGPVAPAAKTKAVAAAATPTNPSKGITDRLAGVGTSDGPTDTAPGAPSGAPEPAPAPTESSSAPAPTASAPGAATPDAPPPATAANTASRFPASMSEPFGVDPRDPTASSAAASPTSDPSPPSAPATPSAPAIAAIQPNQLPVLSRGDHGSAVVTLQTALARRGYTITASGTFDAQTERCVKIYERSNHLKADGVVGPRVWADLAADGR